MSLGRALTTLASIVFGMIAARVLSKHDYATMRQTMLAYSFIAPLLMLALPDALYYFLPREQERKKGVIIDNIFLLFIMALIFSVFLAIGGYKLLAIRFNNPDLSTTLKWMIPYPLYAMPAGILSAVLLTQNRTYLLATYNVISAVLLTSLTITGVLLTKSYSGPLLVQICFPLVLLPIALWLVFKNVPGKFSWPDIKSMKAMLKYSVPLGLAGMLSTIMLETNKIIVSAMCTPEEFANYVNGAMEIPLIGIITGSISAVILVDMTAYIHKGDMMRALDLFKKAALKSAVILFPVTIFLLLSGKSFIVTLYSEKYLESVVPFYIYLFTLPVRIVVYGSALMALGRSRIILYRSILDLTINALLSILLVYLWGYLGAAVATILTLYLWTVPYNLHKIGKGFNVSMFMTLPLRQLSRILLTCLAVALLPLLYLVLFKHPYLVQLLVSSILYFIPLTLILHRKGILEIPSTYLRYLPNFLRNIIIKNEKSTCS